MNTGPEATRNFVHKATTLCGLYVEKPFHCHIADAEWHGDHEPGTPCAPLPTHSLLSSQAAIAYRDSGAPVSIGLVVPLPTE